MVAVNEPHNMFRKVCTISMFDLIYKHVYMMAFTIHKKNPREYFDLVSNVKELVTYLYAGPMYIKFIETFHVAQFIEYYNKMYDRCTSTYNLSVDYFESSGLHFHML